MATKSEEYRQKAEEEVEAAAKAVNDNASQEAHRKLAKLYQELEDWFGENGGLVRQRRSLNCKMDR
jgi:hypothetical protein